MKIQIGGKFLVERLFHMFTMASARFATFSTQEIEKIVENKDSENTKKSTKLAREVFKEYLNEKSLSEPKEPPELAKCLTSFNVLFNGDIENLEICTLQVLFNTVNFLSVFEILSYLCCIYIHRMNNKTIIEFGLRRIPELFRPRSMLTMITLTSV